jgi:hypothetical protein
MVLTPFSRVLRFSVALLVLWLGRIVRRGTILTWSFFMWVRDAFSLLRLLGVCRSKLSQFLLKFLLDLDNISISRAQRGDVQELHLCLNVSMQTDAVFEHQMTLRIFDTQFGA